MILVGPMGVGKTTLGLALARELNRPFLDSDVEMERAQNAAGAEVAEREGVGRLHQLELDVFLGMVRSQDPAVLAPAASVVDSEEGRRAMRRHLTIWLEAPEHLLEERRRSGSHRRGTDEEERTELAERRAPLWADVAEARVDASGRVPDVLAEIRKQVRRSG